MHDATNVATLILRLAGLYLLVTAMLTMLGALLLPGLATLPGVGVGALAGPGIRLLVGAGIYAGARPLGNVIAGDLA